MRRPTALALTVSLALPTVARAAPPAFPSAAFAQLEPTKGSRSRFDWPADEAFAAVWRDAHAERVVPVLFGVAKLRGEEGPSRQIDPLAVAVRREPGATGKDGWRLELVGAPAGRARDLGYPLHGRWRLDTGDPRTGGRVRFSRGRARLVIDAAPIAPRSPLAELWTDWSYVSTLLDGPSPDVRESRPRGPRTDAERADWKALVEALAEPTPESLARVRALIEDPSRPLPFEPAIAAARKLGDESLLRALYARWRPIGRCSMDTRPAELARAHAALCHRQGDRACALQLQLRIMGDRFERVAWSSYGEAIHGTRAEHLTEMGIDVDRFLRGLVPVFQGPDRDTASAPLDAWRLARSIFEAGRAEALDPWLEQLATDPTADVLSRARATWVMAWLRLRMLEAGDRPEDPKLEGLRTLRRQTVAAELAALPLHPALAGFVAELGAAD